MSKKKKDRVSKKIGILVREGKDPKAAAGEAYGMEREGRLTPSGGYRRARKSRRK
jgi:hypothetical protein